MKFLLTAVNAKYIHSNPAIYSLRAYSVQKDSELEKNIELAEYTINQPSRISWRNIYRRKPDCIAFSCYIWNWEIIRDIVRELAKILPMSLFGWEGRRYPIMRRKSWKAAFLTGIMVGEGEETFRELLCYYRNGSTKETADLEKIAGIVFRRHAGICRTGERRLTDISGLPFFYNEEDIGDFHNRIIYYESSRGCPYRCSYCLSSIDKTVRLRSRELVEKELQFFLDKKVPQVKFVDRTFNCDHKHAMGIWKYIKEHDNGITNFHFEISADILKEEELAILQSLRPGLVQLEIGVQSTNPRTIEEIRRSMDWERLRQIVAALREKENIHIHLDLIAGLPYEDMESFRHSFNEVYAAGRSSCSWDF